MKALKVVFSVVFLLVLASNVRMISHWTESRGVYDDICYLRQAHLFQRFGWRGLDTNLAYDNDHYLADKLRAIDFPTWSDVATAPCHSEMADGKRVLTPPPGTGFLLSLFPEGFQVIPLYVLANAIVAGFALLALWQARRADVLAISAVFGTAAIYFMINPTKASYSMAPTMVVCALAGLLTAKLFSEKGQSRLFLIAAIGLFLGLSASFRLPNFLLSSGYFLFYGFSFLRWRDWSRFLQGLSFGLAFAVGMLPFLVANAINAGSPFLTTYDGVDTARPAFDSGVLKAYLQDTQLLLIVLACGWTAIAWCWADRLAIKQLALVVAGNLAVNLAFFATHPVFTQYYTIPISMLSFWTLLFATLKTWEGFRQRGLRAATPAPSSI